MSDPYVGEIRMFGGNFAPQGWAMCDGQTVPIAENDVLFTLIGTTYGGDGQETFNLPDLQSRVPVHQGTNFVLGQMGGTEQETLTTQQVPIHSHAFAASTNNATTPNAQGNVIAQSTSMRYFVEDTPAQAMDARLIGAAGGSQPHGNMMPFCVVSFIISLFGIFPTQN